MRPCRSLTPRKRPGAGRAPCPAREHGAGQATAPVFARGAAPGGAQDDAERAAAELAACSAPTRAASTRCRGRGGRPMPPPTAPARPASGACRTRCGGSSSGWARCRMSARQRGWTCGSSCRGQRRWRQRASRATRCRTRRCCAARRWSSTLVAGLELARQGRVTLAQEEQPRSHHRAGATRAVAAIGCGTPRLPWAMRPPSAGGHAPNSPCNYSAQPTRAQRVARSQGINVRCPGRSRATSSAAFSGLVRRNASHRRIAANCVRNAACLPHHESRPRHPGCPISE